MFSWIKIAVALVQIAQRIIEWQHARGLIKQGADQEAARAGLELARRTSWGREIESGVDNLSRSDIDLILHPDFRDEALPPDDRQGVLPGLSQDPPVKK